MDEDTSPSQPQSPSTAPLPPPEVVKHPEQKTLTAPKPKEPTPTGDPDELHSLDLETGMEEAPTKPSQLIPKKPRRSFKKPLIILGALILLAGVGYGVWTFLKNRDKPASSATTAEQASDTPAAATPKPATLKSYKNDDIKVEVSYPSTWKVADDIDGAVFTSPSFTYKKKDGSSVKGPFRLILQRGINQVDSSTINATVAVKLSEELTYAAPAEGQRKSTYLSFLGKSKDGFEFMLISSGKQFNPGDKVSGTLPLGQDSYVIAGGYGTNEENNISFDTVSVDDIEQNDAYTQAVDIIKSLKIL